MKKIISVAIIFLITLTGCNKTIEPIEVIETDFDLIQAKNIMERTWAPIHEMTNSKLETKPDIEISSREEFFGTYDFDYMDDGMKRDIYENIVAIGNDHKEVKDANGNLVFGAESFIHYIPTIYDDGVYIERAYIQESKYKEEYSYRDRVELIIEENSNEKIGGRALGFNRTNIFRRNENNEWVLTGITGTISIGWERDKE